MMQVWDDRELDYTYMGVVVMSDEMNRFVLCEFRNRWLGLFLLLLSGCEDFAGESKWIFADFKKFTCSNL